MANEKIKSEVPPPIYSEPSSYESIPERKKTNLTKIIAGVVIFAVLIAGASFMFTRQW